jgi:hypothetical protein
MPTGISSATPVTLSVSDVMNSKALLGPFFAGESWATWRSVIKAMTAAEVETFPQRC